MKENAGRAGTQAGSLEDTQQGKVTNDLATRYAWADYSLSVGAGWEHASYR